MDYMIVDVETTIRNTTVGKHKASAFCPDNKIVLLGYTDGDAVITTTSSYAFSSRLKEVNLLVGHNIKFDIHHIWMDNPHSREWFDKGRIWDTQLAEYILSGQSCLYPSLDDCSAKYGGTLKDDKIKTYWNAGMDTTEIPIEELEEYLMWDVKNTETVFMAQWERATELGMLDLILFQMEALLATTEMEFNGMSFDVAKADELSKPIQAEIEKLTHELKSLMIRSGIDEPNVLSNDHLSLLLYGGDYRYISDEPVIGEDGEPVRYKTGLKAGQIKTKKTPKTAPMAGLGIVPRKEWAVKKKGFYRVNDECLSAIITDLIAGDPSLTFTIKLETVAKILKLRGFTKDYSTYYKGYRDLTWEWDGKIHHNLNHCATATGRLSSTSPNLQNTSSVK